MRWEFFRAGRLLDPAERFRREHERWLNYALRHRLDLPRIPTRQVDSGGFARLMSIPMGRRAISRFWAAVLAREDLAESRGRSGR